MLNLTSGKKLMVIDPLVYKILVNGITHQSTQDIVLTLHQNVSNNYLRKVKLKSSRKSAPVILELHDNQGQKTMIDLLKVEMRSQASH